MIARIKSQLIGDGLKARALRGAALTITSTAGGQFLRLVSNLILTRILFPEAFGLMALVTVFITGLQMFSDVGLNASIIQNKRGDDPDFLNTAWTLQIGRGVLLWLATVALAWPVAIFYAEPQLAQLLPVAGLGALIAGFNATNMITVNRHLMLGRLTALTLGCQTVTIIAMVILAWLTESIWALVLGPLVGGSLRMLLSHTALPGIRNRLHLETAAAWELFHFGKYIFLSTLAAFLITQGDRAVLGKFVTLTELALYNIAFFLASAPAIVGRALSDKVLFPLYSNRPPAESAENRAKINKARRLVTGLILVATAILALPGTWLVQIMYDARYHGAGALLILICIGALPGIITQSYGMLLVAAGKSAQFSVFVVSRAVTRLLLLIWAASAFGAVGVALVPLLAELVIYPLSIWLLKPTRGWDWVHDLGFACAGAAIAALAIWINADAVTEALVASGLFLGTP
jgi:O-antigen/teichoic acid export membrane protein